jgi:hypothetical protein
MAITWLRIAEVIVDILKGDYFSISLNLEQPQRALIGRATERDLEGAQRGACA